MRWTPAMQAAMPDPEGFFAMQRQQLYYLPDGTISDEAADSTAFIELTHTPVVFYGHYVGRADDFIIPANEITEDILGGLRFQWTDYVDARGNLHIPDKFLAKNFKGSFMEDWLPVLLFALPVALIGMEAAALAAATGAESAAATGITLDPSELSALDTGIGPMEIPPEPFKPWDLNLPKIPGTNVPVTSAAQTVFKFLNPAAVPNPGGNVPFRSAAYSPQQTQYPQTYNLAPRSDLVQDNTITIATVALIAAKLLLSH